MTTSPTVTNALESSSEISMPNLSSHIMMRSANSIVADGVEKEIFVCTVFIAKVNVGDKSYGFAIEGVTVLCCIVINSYVGVNVFSVFNFRHISNERAKSGKLVCVRNVIYVGIGLVPRIVIISCPS